MYILNAFHQHTQFHQRHCPNEQVTACSILKGIRSHAVCSALVSSFIVISSGASF